MKTLLLIKEIYYEGFKNLGSYIVKHSLKVLTWFTLGIFLVVLYGFLYRLLTGFAFV
ncbi:DUF6747 family protein [Cellulophaga sp. Hel_I_12]|uniref:DUF6747 family protein n=1 Tax=Cellulophaga sp. Hel_I_12 TaxID=1249972 RepID=UPI00350F19AB